MDIKARLGSFFSPNVPWRMLSIPFSIELAIIIVYCLKAVSRFGSTPAPSSLYTAGVISIVCPLIAGIFCLRGTVRHIREQKFVDTGLTCRFSPLLWGISAFIFALSQIIWFGQVLMIHRVPDFPSVAHYIGLLPFFFLIVGVLLLPTRSISLLLRLRILLDSLIIMTAVTTLCFYFILGPLIVKGEGTPQAKIVASLSPALGLFLMFCVLVVALRSRERVLRPVLLFLALATFLQFVADIQHLYELLYHNYNEFSLANIGLILLGFLLIGAAQTVNTLLDKGVLSQQDQVVSDNLLLVEARWKIFLPSILVLVFGILVCCIWINGRQSFTDQIIIMYIGGAIVLLLVLLRQFLTMYQIYILQSKIQARNNALDQINERLVKQATTDPLTDLPNHRALAEKLDESLEQARQKQGACAIIFMDIDHFKATNDAYGHLVGDAVLNSFAQITKTIVRANDMVGRWGGEEFVAILPDTGPEEAFHIAEHIRKAVDQRISRLVRVPGVTCSLGVAAYPQDAQEREDLIWHADRAMYAAKRLGRNQTRTAHEPLVLAKEGALRALDGREKMRVSEIAEALLALVEARDPALSRHARRVAALALKLARELGLSQEEAYIVSLGGLLHDLGDIAMPDTLLFKRSRPDEGELEGRARYPRIGAAILAPVPALEAIAEMVEAHYERMDGSGYPAGLKGEEIPLGARIIAVASAYDVGLGERSGRWKRASAAVLQELRRAAGSRFDPLAIDALERVLAATPRLSRIDVVL